jgi:hypothetical protein
MKLNQQIRPFYMVRYFPFYYGVHNRRIDRRSAGLPSPSCFTNLSDVSEDEARQASKQPANRNGIFALESVTGHRGLSTVARNGARLHPRGETKAHW